MIKELTVRVDEPFLDLVVVDVHMQTLTICELGSIQD